MKALTMSRLLLLLALSMQAGCTYHLIVRPELSSHADAFEGHYLSPERMVLGPYSVTANSQPLIYRARVGYMKVASGGGWQKDFQVANGGEVKSTMRCSYGGESSVQMFGAPVTASEASKPLCTLDDQGVQWNGVVDDTTRGITLTAPNGATWLVETETCDYREREACAYYVVQNEQTIGGLDVLHGATLTLWVARDVPKELQPALVSALSLAFLLRL